MSFTAYKNRDSKPVRAQCCSLKLHSSLRQHFSTAENGRIKCNTCTSAFKCCCTSLRLHIQQEHPSIEVIDDYDPGAFEDPFTAHKQPSDIWKHFSKVKDQKAKCDVCMAVLSVSIGDYSNLWKHLRAMHSAYLSRVKEFLGSNAHEVNADAEASINESPDCGVDDFENPVGDVEEQTVNETEVWWDNDETSDILAQAITISEIPSSSSPKEEATNDTQNITDAEPNERPKRSLIWTYFKKKRANPNLVQCLQCSGLVKYSSILCTTSNMWKHMELKHQLNAKVLKISRKPSDKVAGSGKKLLLDDTIETKEKKRKPTRKPSAVWQYFIRHSQNRAECKLCNSKFKIITGSTSNLRYHVQTKHTEEAVQE